MTWSIVARDEATGQIGIAVATCAFAVGARVPFVATGVGAVATQAFVNPFYGYRGLAAPRGGAVWPVAAPGVGAVAPQAFVNPFYGYRGLELLRAGAAAEDVVRVVT